MKLKRKLIRFAHGSKLALLVDNSITDGVVLSCA